MPISKLMILIPVWLLSSPALAGLSIFTCEPEWAALSKRLAAPDAEIFSATTDGQDPHHVQARPALIAKARNADLMVCTGAELEQGWLPMVLQKARNDKVMPGAPGYVAAADSVALLDKPEVLDRSLGDIHAAGNPHIQLDPRNFLPVADAISQHLQALDASNAKLYQDRLASFKAEWQAAIERWQQQGKGLNNANLVVHHNQWVYLTRWLGMNTLASLEPKPGVPPNAGYLSELKQKLAATQVKAIIRAPIDDERPSEWLAAETGEPALALPFTVADPEDAQALDKMFDAILGQLGKLP